MIGLLNADVDLILMIKKTKRDILDIDIDNKNGIPSNLRGLYIDWIEKPNKGKSKEYAYQAAILDKYIKKKIPIVIFDRYMCITNSEYKWLSKYNVTLYEPALNNRIGFNYMPFPIDIDKYEKKLLEIDDPKPRSIDIGLKGNRKNNSFDKYVVDYIKRNPDKRIVYNDEYLNWNDVKWTIAIDDLHNYSIGHLNHNIIEAIKCGCNVIIPTEHKYYLGLFNNIRTDDINMINYYLDNFTDIMRLYNLIARLDDMKKMYPEFDMKNIADTILEILT